ncbi:hypothetical protein BH09VER1_BH09VER1_47830 [soil metagenome]
MDKFSGTNVADVSGLRIWQQLACNMDTNEK